MSVFRNLLMISKAEQIPDGPWILSSSRTAIKTFKEEVLSYLNTSQIISNDLINPVSKFKIQFEINSELINIGTKKIIQLEGLFELLSQNNKLFISLPFYNSNKQYYIDPALLEQEWNTISIEGDAIKIKIIINGNTNTIIDSSSTRIYDIYTGKSGAYISLNETAPLNTADSWEIQTSIKWNGGSAYPAIFSYSGGIDYKTPSLTYEGGSVKFYLSSNGNSWNLNTSGSSFVPENGNTYDIKAGFTGDTYYLDYKLIDDSEYINAFSKSSTDKVYCSVPFWLMGASLNNNYWNYGALNMTKTKIIINNETWFDGSNNTGFTNNGMIYTQEADGPIYPNINIGELKIYQNKYLIKNISINNGD